VSDNGRHGSRFSGGYQFPRTPAASLKRERAIEREENVGPSRATVELVPLTGGRSIVYDLCARWSGLREMEVERGPAGPVRAAIPASQAWSFLIEEPLLEPGDVAELARRAYAEVLEGFRQGHFPERLP
jgi:hypothetical protein